jgi:hypothetical protein
MFATALEAAETCPTTALNEKRANLGKLTQIQLLFLFL